jgi:hypothetical protein
MLVSINETDDPKCIHPDFSIRCDIVGDVTEFVDLPVWCEFADLDDPRALQRYRSNSLSVISMYWPLETS